MKELSKVLSDFTEFLFNLGLPYMEISQVAQDVSEGNYDIFLQDTVGEEELANRIAKLKMNMEIPTNTIQEIRDWFLKAKPEATDQNLVQQLAYALEEISELFEAIGYQDASRHMEQLKDYTLGVSRKEDCTEVVSKWDRKATLDAIGDIIVTLVGVATYAKMDIVGGLQEISDSNYSKFVAGEPLLDKDGKITKGPNYFKPELEKFL